MDPKRRVLFISDLTPAGGGGAVSAWMLQALAADYEVVILTWRKPDFPAVDRLFATSLAGLSFEILRPGPLERWMIERIPDDSNMQCANYLLRTAKRIAGDFDAVIACSDFESDLGFPGIQYVHYPYLARLWKVLTVQGDAPWPAGIRALIRGRVRPWMIISGYSFERMRANLHLTNSHWTRNEIRRLFDMGSTVVYPPAPGDYRPVDWDQRENGFIAIGRFHTMKRFDWIVETIAEVRKQEPSIRLHLCGTQDSPGILERLQALAREHGPWIEIHRDLSSRDLTALACRQRYGIHAMVDEHFGIAPAQMARAGCIPFVHNSGGQVEIVDSDPRLCFSTREEAVAKILAVMSARTAQDDLHSSVQHRSHRFSCEAFSQNIRTHVRDFISRRKSVPALSRDHESVLLP